MKRPRDRPAPAARAASRSSRCSVALFVFLTGVTGILALMTTALALHRDGLQTAGGRHAADRRRRRAAQREIAVGQHRAGNGEDYTDVAGAAPA